MLDRERVVHLRRQLKLPKKNLATKKHVVSPRSQSINPTHFTRRRLPAQVALNLALLLTGRRDAQLDAEDIATTGQGEADSHGAGGVLARVAPHCHPLVVYKNSSDSAWRTFWSILWVDHHRFGREKTFVECATNLLHFREMDDAEAMQRASRTRSATTWSTTPVTQSTNIGRMLGLDCSPRAFVSHKTHRYRIMIVAMQHPGRTSGARSRRRRSPNRTSWSRSRGLRGNRRVQTRRGATWGLCRGERCTPGSLGAESDYAEEDAFTGPTGWRSQVVPQRAEEHDTSSLDYLTML